MKVLVTDKINNVAADILLKGENIDVDILPTMSEDELCKIIPEYDALMIRSQTKVTEKVLQAGINLKIIGRAGVGVDNIDIDCATQRGIVVVNSPDGNTKAAAEHTIAMMLAMSRNIPMAHEITSQGIWDRAKFTGVEVFDKNLGIIGFGKIGSHVANVALALGMNVYVCDPYTTKEVVESKGCKYIESFDELFKLSNYITVHTPKTKETTHLINAESISKMKDGVRIVNCARGGIIDEKALCDAINSGKVKSAAIDVYEDEPDIKKSPLLNVKNKVVLTPHLGASTTEAQLNVAIDVAQQIRSFLTGGNVKSPVNIPFKIDKLEPVKDYMKLAENLGELAKQIHEETISSVEITVKGGLANLDVTPLEIAILKGIFSSTGNVNFVNAGILAKNKGINVTTSKSAELGNYIGYICVNLNSGKTTTSVAGAIITKDISRIVSINQYDTSVEPVKNILLVPHKNIPSMVAKVATVIGENGINIENMQVVQKEKNDSLMIINTDVEVSETVLSSIKYINGVKSAKYVKLMV